MTLKYLSDQLLKILNSGNGDKEVYCYESGWDEFVEFDIANVAEEKYKVRLSLSDRKYTRTCGN